MARKVRQESAMRPYYLLLLSFAIPAVSQAQLFTFGVKGGVPAETPIGRADGGIPFSAGPTVNVRIFSRLSLETGVTYQSMGRSTQSATFLVPENSVALTFNSQKAHAIEVPILAKFYVLNQSRAWKPFVTVGPAVRRTSLDSAYVSSILSGNGFTTLGTTQQSLGAKRSEWNVDPEVGVGVDVKTGRFHLEPEVRYSYWGAGVDMYPVRKNQVQFLMGFRF